MCDCVILRYSVKVRDQYQKENTSLTVFSLSKSMRKSEEKLKREEVKMKGKERVAEGIKEGNSTHYAAGHSALNHCQASSALREAEIGENRIWKCFVDNIV